MNERGSTDAAPQVKLVIWDLDETLWAGVLSEGEIVVSGTRVDQVRDLVDHGVMVSVSSRNDEAAARAVLERHGLWRLVIFPRINWEAKGGQVRDLIEAAQLRPFNVLFVDDNHLNREEASFFAPGLQIADPADPGFDARIDAIVRAGRDDPEHRRLAEYRHLETRASASVGFDDNREFLRSCAIRVELRPAGPAQAKRIHELIGRTNQLNYTKRRVSEADVAALLADPAVASLAIHVTDRFGDYGLVGFAAVRDARVDQLAFSCRILGMAVERAVYERLGRPAIDVAEPVSAPLDGDTPDWLTIVEAPAGPAEDGSVGHPLAAANATGERRGRRPRPGAAPASILFVGGCDLESAVAFLERPNGVVTHFNYSPPDRPRLQVHRDSIDYLLADTWPAGPGRRCSTRRRSWTIASSTCRTGGASRTSSTAR
jgi:FkbH-like protein